MRSACATGRDRGSGPQTLGCLPRDRATRRQAQARRRTPMTYPGRGRLSPELMKARRLDEQRLKTVLGRATGTTVSIDREWGVSCNLEGAKERGIGLRSYLRPDRGDIMLAAWPADTLT